MLKKILLNFVFLVILFSPAHAVISLTDPPLSFTDNSKPWHTVEMASGFPFYVRGLTGDWSNPERIYSDKNQDVYISQNDIPLNILLGKYIQTGNFTIRLYFIVKDQKTKNALINSVKEDLAKNPQMQLSGHADLFIGLTHDATFDMQNKQVTINSRESYFDRDGDLISMTNVNQTISFKNDKFYKDIAGGIQKILMETLKDPKNATYLNVLSGNSAADLLNKANTLYDEIKSEYNNPVKAIEYLDMAIRLKSDYAEAYYCRGIAYFCLQQYQQAIKDLDKAIHLKPDFALAYANRGRTYDELGQYQRSIKDYDKAISYKPVWAYNVFYSRGCAYDKIGHHQQAIQDISESIRLKPDFSKAYHERGFLYAKLGQYQLAIKDYNERIRLEPNFLTYNNRGWVYYKVGQYEQAIADLSESIRLKPDFANAYRHRGNSYRELGQYQHAATDLHEAIRLKTDYSEAYNDIGLVFIKSGNKKEGCRSLIKACKLGSCDGYNSAKQKRDCR